MNARNRSPIERVDDLPRILEEVQRSVREALARHRRSGNPVPVWRNKQVCWIPAAEIPSEWAR
jgi:hypothetical protein